MRSEAPVKCINKTGRRFKEDDDSIGCLLMSSKRLLAMF